MRERLGVLEKPREMTLPAFAPLGLAQAVPCLGAADARVTMPLVVVAPRWLAARDKAERLAVERRRKADQKARREQQRRMQTQRRSQQQAFQYD